ncbi:MAG: phosphatase PAP2 family protein [Ectothiorhodospiraceae bacterium]|nr:phosphatase PAP2 family protein [Chromatiales bacterium]MCP5154699.1 phosphatase PAP2 family protein [Ectothiorhodospiraceae bacterium]
MQRTRPGRTRHLLAGAPRRGPGLTRLGLLAVVVAALTGCATSGAAPWGSRATLAPGLRVIADAAVDAAKAPEVWGSLLAAGALQIGGADDNVSDWASKKTPLFGSQSDAVSAGDTIVDVGTGLMIATALATPSSPEVGRAVRDKGAGLALAGAAVLATKGATDVLKAATGRTRPNGSDDESLPSSVASLAAVQYALAARNVESMTASRSARLGARAGAYGTSLLAGWARVEARKHHPSDVLVGVALGTFVARFVSNAFIEPGGPTLEAHVDPGGDMVAMRLGMHF